VPPALVDIDELDPELPDFAFVLQAASAAAAVPAARTAPPRKMLRREYTRRTESHLFTDSAITPTFPSEPRDARPPNARGVS
jgi:hypothetical protein